MIGSAMSYDYPYAPSSATKDQAGPPDRSAPMGQPLSWNMSTYTKLVNYATGHFLVRGKYGSKVNKI